MKHNYTVLNKRTKQPISSASISSTKPSLFQIQNYQEITDDKGKLNISYGKAPIYKQIFKHSSADIYVQKGGYKNLEANVPLGFFKTRKSIIYLDENPPLKPVEDCNSGGDASQSGEKSVQEFDLKEDKGEFVFVFNTGNMIPDEIRVYNCTKNDIANHTPIFHVDEAISNEIVLNFTNRHITVVVDGRGNENSVWQYFVNCP